jgi:hypothetical protein
VEFAVLFNIVLRLMAMMKLPTLTQLKCRAIKGDDDNILVDYGQYDEGSEKPNHNHTAIVSRAELRRLLWEMIKYVEDGNVVVALDQARREAARKRLATLRTQCAIGE